MLPAITNCLLLQDKVEQAVNFYLNIFQNGKVVDTLREPAEDEDTEGNLMGISFTLEGVPFLALKGGPPIKISPAISLMVTCGSADEVKRLWEKLSVGHSSVLMPLEKYPFSDCFGWVADKFGLTWQLILKEDFTGQKIHPSLLFVNDSFGKAEEAINFYTSVFRDSEVRNLTRYDEMTNGAGMEIAYADFSLLGQWFSAMDGPGDHKFRFNESFSFMVACSSQAEIDEYWQTLSAHPESEMCGWLRDRFGISWQIVPQDILRLLKKDGKNASRTTMERMMKMKKLDISELASA